MSDASKRILSTSFRKKEASGLSLLEVILALAILAIAVAILSQTMYLAAENGTRSKEMMAAQMLCESTMSEIITGIVPAQSTSWASISSSSSSTDWSYMVEMLPAEQPGMMGVQVTVTNDPNRTSKSPIDVKLVRWIIDPNLGLDVAPAASGTMGATELARLPHRLRHRQQEEDSHAKAFRFFPSRALAGTRPHGAGDCLVRSIDAELHRADQRTGRASMMDQEARKILVMISDDIRGVVRNQAFDAAALQQIIGSPQAGGGGGPGAEVEVLEPQVVEQVPPHPRRPQSRRACRDQVSLRPAVGRRRGCRPDGRGSGSTSSTPSTSSTGSTASAYPPGVYGTSTALEIDISRIPRPDQYFVDQTGLGQSKLVDVPSDTKTVSYFVQVPTTMGVEDLLSSTATGSGGWFEDKSIDRSPNGHRNKVGPTS